MKIGIGNDHVGYEYKLIVKKHLEELGHTVIDYGSFCSDRCDYPVYGYKVARAIVEKEVEAGVLICGTGVGISLAANKVKGIRACVCSEETTAEFSKRHNNANIIAFGARIIPVEKGIKIVDAWLNAPFEGGRHLDRINLLTEIEEKGQLKTNG